MTPTTKLAYRVHASPLSAGDKVPPSHWFFESVESKPGRKRIEDAFESARPDTKPSRSCCVFVFPVEADARSWICQKRSHYLYQVSVPDGGVLHEADWMWLNKSLGDSELAAAAKSYWDGAISGTLVREWMVSEATVVLEIVVPQSEREEWRKCRYGLPTTADYARRDVENG